MFDSAQSFILSPISDRSNDEDVEVVINVYDISDYGLKLSDRADIESAEFPVYSVQKPRLVVVPGKNWPLNGIFDIAESDVSRFTCI